MANSPRFIPGSTSRKSNETEKNPLDDLMAFYENHKNNINYAVSGVVIAVFAVFAYIKMYKQPNEEKAATALSYPQMYFQADSLNLALNGDGKHKGFEKIAKQYDGTDAGNIAHLYEGVSYMKMGDFPKAIKALEKFDGKGTLLAYQGWGLLGEAYMESGNKSKAIEYFKKATGDKEDVVFTPLYLFHLGLAYQANNQANDAKTAFKRIRDEYPKSTQARDIDKELAKLGEID